jgi:hypothetical protein
LAKARPKAKAVEKPKVEAEEEAVDMGEPAREDLAEAAAEMGAIAIEEEAEELKPEKEKPPAAAQDMDLAATQVSVPLSKLTAPPVPEEDEETLSRTMAEEEEDVNVYTPIEQTDLVDEKVKDKKTEAPPVEAADQEDESEMMAGPAEKFTGTLDADIEKTQLYDRESLSRAITEDEEEEVPDLSQGLPTLAAEDAGAADSFMMGGEEDAGQAVETAEPPPGPQAAAGVSQEPAPPKAAEEAPPPAAAQAGQAAEAQIEEQKEEKDEDLITGEDVIKKMDDFFGFE